jgi:hypothetical protein
MKVTSTGMTMEIPIGQSIQPLVLLAVPGMHRLSATRRGG